MSRKGQVTGKQTTSLGSVRSKSILLSVFSQCSPKQYLTLLHDQL